MRYQIPLEKGAQSFSVSLGGVYYQMRLVYRDAVLGGWFLDMVQEATGKGVYGLPVVIGSDLLDQHKHLHFGHIFCDIEGGFKRHPRYEDMGTSLRMIWSDDDDDE